MLPILTVLIAEEIIERRWPGGHRNSGRNGTGWLYFIAHYPAGSNLSLNNRGSSNLSRFAEVLQS